MAPRIVPLCVFLVSCGPSIHFSEAQLDAFHRDCQTRIKNGYQVSPRADAVGRIHPKKPAGTSVVVYGAAWCEACVVAKEYMTRQKIPYVYFDIEENDAANSAMLSTLAAAGLPDSHKLPVLDVRGTVTLGFNFCVLEAAWSES